MAYRNELAAAQSRGVALEREVGNLRRQLDEHGAGTENGVWNRLMDRGASEENRFREAAWRQHHKSAAAKQKAQASQQRSDRRAAKFRRFDEGRRYARSTTRLGWCAHWFFPLLVVMASCFFFALPLYIVVPSTLWLIPASFAAALIAWGLSNLRGIFLARGEDERSEALPFRVDGHHEVLKTDLCGLHMSLSFEASAPTEAQMQRWTYGLATEIRNSKLRSIVRNMKIESVDLTIVVTPENLETKWMAGNRSYLLWYRRVVEEALVELHEAFPLLRVTMVHVE